MRTPLLPLTLTLLLGACIGDLGSRPLYGSWGGSALVEAMPGGVKITLACGFIAQISHTVTVDGSGRFSVQGVLRGYDNSSRDTIPLPPVLPAHITGTVIGDRIMASIQFTAGQRADTITFDGLSGQPPPAPVFCR